MDGTEVIHLHDTAELFRFHLCDRREDGDHGVVDPHVDRPEPRFGVGREALDLFGVGHVTSDDHGLGSCCLRLSRGCLESFQRARDQSEAVTSSCKCTG